MRRASLPAFFMRSSVHSAVTRLVTYAVLLLGSAAFVLPFLWMVSGSFKDLETVFEYPPTLLPMENVKFKKDGRELPLADYRAGRVSHRVMVHDRRPGEYLVELLSSPPPGELEPASFQEPVRVWVPDTQVDLLRRLRFRSENYVKAWTAKPFTRFTANTIFVTVCCIIGQVWSASLVGFAFARLRWPGRNLLFFVALSTMMLPPQVTMIPTFLLFRALGWIDTFLPLIAPSFLGGGAFFIFLFRQFFATLPRELDEAARVDGCSSLRIYWNVLMPLCKPVIATIAVLSFITHWNDFLTPLIYLNSSEKFTLAVGLRFFQGTYNTDMHLLMAASTLVLIPVIIVFFLAQKHFVKSIVLSGIKG